MQRWRRDPWVQQARREASRSRAVYKLQEIDRRDQLLRPGQVVIDLGAAPGSWTRYARRRLGNSGRLLAVDRTPMKAVPGVSCIEGDFSLPAVRAQCREWLSDQQADLVLCDIAPNMSGVRGVDQARSMALVNCATEFSCQVLRPGGALLVKVFAGDGLAEYTDRLQQAFSRVDTRKPRASRSGSRELYVLARRRLDRDW